MILEILKCLLVAAAIGWLFWVGGNDKRLP